MIRNRYSYLTPSVEGTEGKGRTESNCATIKTQPAEIQKESLFPKTDQAAIQNKNKETYNGRNSKPQQKHRLGTVSKKITGRWGVGGLNGFYVVTTLASPFVLFVHWK